MTTSYLYSFHGTRVRVLATYYLEHPHRVAGTERCVVSIVSSVWYCVCSMGKRLEIMEVWSVGL